MNRRRRDRVCGWLFGLEDEGAGTDLDQVAGRQASLRDEVPVDADALRICRSRFEPGLAPADAADDWGDVVFVDADCAVFQSADQDGFAVATIPVVATAGPVGGFRGMP